MLLLFFHFLDTQHSYYTLKLVSRRVSCTVHAMAQEEEDDEEYIFVIELEDCATAASATSSPMDIDRQQRFSMPFAISPGKDSVIEEDTSGWNPNDAFNEVCEPHERDVFLLVNPFSCALPI